MEFTRKKEFLDAHKKLWSKVKEEKDTKKAMLYAFIAMGEAIKETLEQGSTGLEYALYDLYSLLVLSLGKSYEYKTHERFWQPVVDTVYQINNIAGNVGNAVYMLNNSHATWTAYVEKAIVILAMTSEFDPNVAVERYLEKLKYLEKPEEVTNGKKSKNKRTRMGKRSSTDTKATVSESAEAT